MTHCQLSLAPTIFVAVPSKYSSKDLWKDHQKQVVQLSVLVGEGDTVNYRAGGKLIGWRKKIYHNTSANLYNKQILLNLE